MSKTPMMIYYENVGVGMHPTISGLNAVYAHARREALEEAARIADAFADDTKQNSYEGRGHWTEQSEAVFNAQQELAREIRALLNASPGSGVPDDAEGRGRAPSTAGGQYGALSGSLENDAPSSVPPATTSAPPQEGDDHPGPIAPLKPAAAAPSGPTETELDYANEVLAGGYDGVKNILANAVIRWKEQSK